MSWPYLHTLINHFPIVLTVVGAVAVLFASLIARRAIWVYSLACLVLAGVTIYPAWLSGGRAAGMVRKAWYIVPGAIHSHAAAADVTIWVVGVTAFIALIALVTLARVPEAPSPAKGFRILVGLGAIASICAVSYTGFLGGRIVVESPILMAPTPPPALDSLGRPILMPPAGGAPVTAPNSVTSPGVNPAAAGTSQTQVPQVPQTTQQPIPQPQQQNLQQNPQQNLQQNPQQSLQPNPQARMTVPVNPAKPDAA
jgi:hypothetical protein